MRKAPSKVRTRLKGASRGKLISMRVSPGFRAYAIEQLASVRHLRDRAMFGGVGLYADEVFFGILAADVLYLKVDDRSRPVYEAAGSKPFKPYADRPMTMSYYAVPVSVLEDATTLVQWANRAVAAGMAATAKRPARSSR
jgi:DNA transformation protein